MNAQIQHIIEYIRNAKGIDLSVYDIEYLKRMLSRRMEATGSTYDASYLELLRTVPGESSELISLLGNTYTDFFREALTYAFLEQYTIPSLLECKCETSTRFVRVWSAGCSTGQEAYSIAMLLDEQIATRGCGCTYQIIATDLSASALDASRRGLFEIAAMRNLRHKHIESYFTAEASSWRIIPRIQTKMEFEQYDILDSHSFSPPSGIYGEFDIVVCSNVLLYYNPRMRDVILEKIHRSLSTGGFFVTSEAECEIVAGSRFFRAVAPHIPIFSATNNE